MKKKKQQFEVSAMGSEARSLRRSSLRGSRTINSPKPFSDCTNTISQSHSLVHSKPKPKPKTCSQPKIHPNLSFSEPFTPPPLPRISSPSGGDGNDTVLEIRTVYNRKQTADKRKNREKTDVAPFSSYSADRAVNDGNKKNEYEDEDLWETRTVPHMKKHRHAQAEHDASENSLQYYIQQQKAYFNEVDAFELPEEEIGSGNELDSE